MNRMNDAIEAVSTTLTPRQTQKDIHGRIFQEIVVEYPSISTYPEYKGKPYFAIKYTENGQEFIGYGTYKPEVLSEYLKEYFMPSAQPKRTEIARKTHACDLIERQALMKEFSDFVRASNNSDFAQTPTWNDAVSLVGSMPSAQSDYQEVLGWLLAYHTMSFDLHGRYLPHEVISWLINDFTKEFIAGREQNG